MVGVLSLSPEQIRRVHEYYRSRTDGWVLCADRMPNHDDSLYVGQPEWRDRMDDPNYSDNHLVIILVSETEPVQTVIGSVRFEGGGMFKAWQRIVPESWETSSAKI